MLHANIPLYPSDLLFELMPSLDPLHPSPLFGPSTFINVLPCYYLAGLSSFKSEQVCRGSLKAGFCYDSELQTGSWAKFSTRLHLPLGEQCSRSEGKVLKYPSVAPKSHCGQSLLGSILSKHVSFPEVWADAAQLASVALGGCRRVFTELPQQNSKMPIGKGKLFTVTTVSSSESAVLWFSS